MVACRRPPARRGRSPARSADRRLDLGAGQDGRLWLRRITHETLIHRVDAELAAGRNVVIAPDLAADGISDLLMMFTVFPQIDDFPELAALRGTGELLHFHATDDGLGAAGEWLVRRNPAGIEWEHGHAKGDVAVRGPAAALLLVLSRRTALAAATEVEVIGDEKLFAHWLAHSVF